MNEAPAAPQIVVYGGTASAIAAALQADRMGMQVVLVSPDKHLGGLVSSGLGWTDSKDGDAIGGIAREFYHRLWIYYKRSEAWTREDPARYLEQVKKGRGSAQPGPTIDDDREVMWTHEPHAAEEVFEEMLAESKVTVYRNEWIDRDQGVEVQDRRIRQIRTLSGRIFAADVFIDASYEGDLMATAGVAHRIGRDSAAEYQEPVGGIYFATADKGESAHDKALAEIDPYQIPGDPSSGLIWGVEGELPENEKSGDADGRLQAFNFRLCLTSDPSNQVRIEQPEDYDETRYELLFRLYEKGHASGFSITEAMPNGKTDTNNSGFFSTDYLGGNYSVKEGWNYSSASYEKRREIIRDHVNYTKGLLWTVMNHPRVPKEARQKWSAYGLAADEFTDNGNWPYQLYVREARRMCGTFVMTQHHYLPSPEYPIADSIGLGSYSLDCHKVRRVKDGAILRPEGGFYFMGLHTYPISYGAIVPKREEIQNLLVPVTLSASHVIFGSIRMEPTYMILGQSAGVAAALAAKSGGAVQDVVYTELAARLTAAGQVLSPEEVADKKKRRENGKAHTKLGPSPTILAQ